MHAEERLFIEAIRDLNFQASRLQAEENSSIQPAKSDRVDDSNSDGNSASDIDKPNGSLLAAVPDFNNTGIKILPLYIYIAFLIFDFFLCIQLSAELTVASKLFPFATKKAEVNNSAPNSLSNPELSSSSDARKTLFSQDQNSPFSLPLVSLPAVGYSLSALDPSSGLDKAAELVTDAAIRANSCNPSPSLQSAISWMRTMSREHVHELNNESNSSLDLKSEFSLEDNAYSQANLAGKNFDTNYQDYCPVNYDNYQRVANGSSKESSHFKDSSSIGCLDSSKCKKKRVRDK